MYLYILVLVALVAQCSGMRADLKEGLPILSDELIQKINSDPESTWLAGRNDYFEGMTFGAAQLLMGAKEDTLRSTLDEVSFDASVKAPASFDSRNQWPGKIGPVLNQAKCGSCWAFGATESISDRTAIKNGTFVQLGPLDLVTCDQTNDGCDGGMLSSAWIWARDNGLVTESCYPYGAWETPNPGPVQTCPAASQPCLPPFQQTPSCQSGTCKDGTSWKADRHFVSSVYSVSGEDQYMKEVSTNGPFEVAFTVYEDFVHYKSGVYQHTSGQMLGGHAVKLIGYGTLNGTPYWLIQNSWTTTWGDKGYFMILRGPDECGIQSSGVGGKI